MSISFGSFTTGNDRHFCVRRLIGVTLYHTTFPCIAIIYDCQRSGVWVPDTFPETSSSQRRQQQQDNNAGGVSILSASLSCLDDWLDEYDDDASADHVDFDDDDVEHKRDDHHDDNRQQQP